MKTMWSWTALLVVVTTSSGAAASDAPLLAAVKSQNVAAVRTLLQRGADVNRRGPDGSTALSWAVHRDDLATVDVLLGAGADVNAANDYGIGPLSLACENGSPAMVERLLRAGADPNARRRTGLTVLMTCARAGNPATIRALLTAGAEANATEPQRGQDALMWAADQGHAAAMQVLLDAGANIQVRSHGGYTPLLLAVRAGAHEATRQLLERGANVNDVVAPTVAAAPMDPYAGDPATGAGASALIVAAVCGHWELAALLLERGADPNANAAGFTALHWASGEWEADITGPFGAAGYRWIAALRPGKLELVKTLLARGADVNARMTKAPPSLAFSLGSSLQALGATPLLLAANAGEADIMRALLAAGADPRLTTNDKTDVLMAAAGLGRVNGESSVMPDATVEVTTLALDLGLDVRAANNAGETALHGAAYWGADGIVQLLVDAGAQVNARNTSWGYTPLSIAERFSGPSTGANTVSNPTTAALLRTLGGDTGIELEGAITQVLAGCPSAIVLVMPPSFGAARYGRGHVVRASTTTTFANGGCAALTEGATIAVKGVREVDYSTAASEIRIVGTK